MKKLMLPMLLMLGLTALADDMPFWGDEPNPTNYVKVLRAAYEEVKAADPAAVDAFQAAMSAGGVEKPTAIPLFLLEGRCLRALT